MEGATRVVNWWIGAAVKFYDMLQGFRAGRGIRTTYLKAKLLQKLMAMREGVL